MYLALECGYLIPRLLLYDLRSYDRLVEAAVPMQGALDFPMNHANQDQAHYCSLFP